MGATPHQRTIGYSFDGAGRLTQEKREERATLADSSTRDQTTTTGYVYDAVSNRSSLTTNTYSGIGAAATLTGTSTTASNYNANDQLTSVTQTAGNAPDVATTYGYDANGAQTSVTVGNVTTPYSYDFEGELTSVGDAERAGFQLVDVMNTQPETAILGIGVQVCRYVIEQP